jgi:hypothetical protein
MVPERARAVLSRLWVSLRGMAPRQAAMRVLPWTNLSLPFSLRGLRTPNKTF